MKKLFNILTDWRSPKKLKDNSLEEYVYLIKVMIVFAFPFAIALLIALAP